MNLGAMEARIVVLERERREDRREFKEAVDALTRGVAELAKSSGSQRMHVEGIARDVHRFTEAWEGNGRPGYKTRVHALEVTASRGTKLFWAAAGFGALAIGNLIWTAVTGGN